MNITEIKIKWCPLCGWYIECPVCGNNSCNGGRGTINDKECEYCDNIYILSDCIGADAETSMVLTKILQPKRKLERENKENFKIEKKPQRRGKDGRFL